LNLFGYIPRRGVPAEVGPDYPTPWGGIGFIVSAHYDAGRFFHSAYQKD